MNVMTDPSVIAPLTIAMVGEATASNVTGTGERVQMPYYADLE